MKAGRKVLSVLAVLVLLVLVALVSVFIFIDSIAKKGIESGATFALGVPTTLQTADVGVLGGTFSMAGLEVDNPRASRLPTSSPWAPAASPSLSARSPKTPSNCPCSSSPT